MKYFSFLLVFVCCMYETSAQQFLGAKILPVQANKTFHNCLALDNADNIYTATALDTSSAVLIKTDPLGNELWRTYLNGNVTIVDIQSYNNNTYICGNFQHILTAAGTSYTNAGSADFFLACFDNIGNLQWLKAYGDSADNQVNDLLVVANSIYVVGSTGVLTQGITSPQYSLQSNMIFNRYDLSGNVMISQTATTTYSSSSSFGEKIEYFNGQISLFGSYVEQIIIDTVQTSYYSGGNVRRYFVASVNTNGHFISIKNTPLYAHYVYNSLKVRFDGSVVVTGYDSWTAGTRGEILTLNSNYTLSDETFQDNNCYGKDIEYNDVIIMGHNYLTVGKNYANCQVPQSPHYMILAKYNDTLNPVFIHEIPSTATISADCIRKDSQGNYVISGLIQNGGIKLGPDSISANGNAIFITRFNDFLPVNVPELQESSSDFSIFPNPSSGEVTFKFKTPFLSSTVLISDQLGRKVLFYSAISETLTVRDLFPGFYTVQVNNGSKGTFMKKLVIR